MGDTGRRPQIEENHGVIAFCFHRADNSESSVPSAMVHAHWERISISASMMTAQSNRTHQATISALTRSGRSDRQAVLTGGKDWNRTNIYSIAALSHEPFCYPTALMIQANLS
jgi:hypothetical protein